MNLPNDVNAEQALLGSILYEPENASQFIEGLEVSDFYFKENQNLFTAIKYLIEHGLDVDVTTISSHLKALNLLEETGGVNYISDVTNLLPTSEYYKTYLKKVKACSIQRQLIEACNDVINNIAVSNEDIDDILDNVENRIYAITNKRTSGEFEKIDTVVDRLQETLVSRKSKEFTRSLDTGFAEYDKLTSGMKPGELIILAARPGVGKSAFAINIANNVAAEGKSVAIFTLEMSSEQVTERLMSLVAHVDNERLRDGTYDADDAKNITAASQVLKNLNIYFDDRSGIRISDVYTKCHQLSKNKQLDFVIIDYLQLLSGSATNQANRVQEISEISRKLKNMARDLEVPVLALSQLSRTIESRGADAEPQLSDLRESGSIEQDADVVLFLGRKKIEGIEENSGSLRSPEQPITVYVRKNRSGSTGNFNLTYMGAMYQFIANKN